MSDLDPGSDRRARLRAARLYLVCDATPGGRELTDLLRAVIPAGVNVVQLREKQLSDERLAESARSAREVCHELGALFIVNDRPAVAVAVRADGVHVGQEDMGVEEARAVVGHDLLIGLSTHSPLQIDAATPLMWREEARSASGQGRPDGPPAPVTQNAGQDAPLGHPYVDYIGVGPVYATPTKPGRPGVGTELVSYAYAHAHVPFFAIGGIDSDNVETVLDAGASRICVLRAISAAGDPEQATRTLREALELRALWDGDGRR